MHSSENEHCSVLAKVMGSNPSEAQGFVIFSLMQKIALRIMRPYTIDIEVVIM